MSDTWMESFDPERLGRAVVTAGDLHRLQARKGTRVHYMSHLLAVAALVAEDEGTEEEVLAAVLHDAAEDQGGLPVLDRIERELGSAIASIVRECSDSLLGAGAEKAPWRDRKEETLRLLPSRSASALRVIAADKLHNTRATLVDVVIEGATTWDRFKSGRDGFLWYHERMVAELKTLLPGSRSVVLLEREVSALSRAGA